jgi:two-component system sensor histidine kinase PilS (NtrC family)
VKLNFFDLRIDKKLKILMAGRLIIATAMLGGAVLTAFPRLNFYYLIVSIYLLTIFYIFALKSGRAIVSQAYLQIIFDGIFLTGLIHWTGGIDSPFIFLYILPIISSAVIISSRACITAAIFSSVFYAVFVKLESYEIIRPFNHASYMDHGIVTYFLFLHVSMMIVISLLSSYLSESLRRKGDELKELRSFTDEILNNIPNGVIAFNPSNRITYLNNFSRSMLKIPPSGSLKNKFIFDLFPLKKERVDFQRLRHQPVIEGETNIELNGNKKMPVRYVATRLYYDDRRIKGGVLIFHDLSRERLSAIGEMAAELAHEIRNPLAAMNGSLEILREDPLSGENEEIIELVMKEAQCLNTILNDFLHFSRPRELCLTSYPLKRVIDEAITRVHNHPHFSDRIKIHFSNNVNPEIKIDRDEIKQAFFNLSLNAVESMPAGGNLRIKTEEDAQEKTVRVFFRDEGAGILPRDKEHLFEPFYTTKTRGVGLGLAISSRIVKDHGGDISVENNTGPGATFVVKLPIV